MAQRIQAEMWDKLHYLFRTYNDRVIHVELHYDFELDAEIVKKFVANLYEKAPVLHSSFVNNYIRPYWRVNPYNIDDVFTIKHITEAEKDAEIEAFLMQEINPGDKLQFRVGLFYYEGKTAFCFVSNHMCFDGGDTKYIVAKLCQAYNEFVETGKITNDIRVGSRSHKMIYRDLSEEDRKAAGRLIRNPSVKDPHKFPLTKSEPTDKSFMAKHTLDRDVFKNVKILGKKNGFTLNDILMAAYFESVYRLANFDKSDSLVIAGAIDLRRYIKSMEGVGLTNHTAWMQCRIPHLGKDIFETLKLVSESTNEFKKDKFMGMYGLPLLNFGYTLPHFIGEIAVKIGYANPHLAMSNIGFIDPVATSLCGHEPIYGFMSGAVKYKPFVLLSAITYKEDCILAMGVRGNEKDKEIVNKFYSIYDECLNEIIEGWKE